MKKIAALCIGVGCMLTVTGCGSNVTLNTEQMIWYRNILRVFF